MGNNKLQHNALQRRALHNKRLRRNPSRPRRAHSKHLSNAIFPLQKALRRANNGLEQHFKANFRRPRRVGQMSGPVDVFAAHF